MVAVAEFLAQLMLALLQAVAELLCYVTSRFLLPVFTRGRVVVMPMGALARRAGSFRAAAFRTERSASTVISPS
jgi:hypothetical protein